MRPGLFAPVVLRKKDLAYYRKVLQVQKANLVRYWPLWETAGADAADLGPSGDAAAYNGVTLANTTGPDGVNGAPLLATPDNVDVFTAALATAWPGDEGSLQLWIKASAEAIWTDANLYYLSLPYSTLWDDYIEYRTIGDGQLWFKRGAGGATHTRATPVSGADWVHTLLTWSVAASTMKVWVNGFEYEPNATAGMQAWAGALTTMLIGAGGGTFPGWIAHCALWNTPINGADVAVLAGKTGQVIFDGDSRIKGYAGVQWAQQVAYVCMANLPTLGWSVVAVEGRATDTMITDAIANVNPLRRGQLAKNDVVAWSGVNDVMGGASAATAHSRLQTYCLARKAAGFRVILCTEIDAQSAGANAADWHATKWAALNTLIAANWESYADGLADLGANANLQNALDLTYFSADKIHLNAAGYAVAAGIIETAIGAL